MPVFLPHIDDEQEFTLLGVSCHERDYRLVWRMNKIMQWNLERWDDFLRDVNDRESLHSCFRMIWDDENIIITLYQNKSGGGVLLPELSQFDYLLKIENTTREFLEDAKQRIKKTAGVLAVMEFDTERIKSIAAL